MLGWITDIPSVLTATVGRSVGITYDKAMFGGGLVEVGTDSVCRFCRISVSIDYKRSILPMPSGINIE